MYNSLHDWMPGNMPKKKYCNDCRKKKKLELANNGIYNRDFKNWKWLCRRCHMKSDGRLHTFMLNRNTKGWSSSKKKKLRINKYPKIATIVGEQ